MFWGLPIEYRLLLKGRLLTRFIQMHFLFEWLARCLLGQMSSPVLRICTWAFDQIDLCNLI